MNKATKKQIIEILKSCVDRALERIAEDKTYRPFHEVLLTKKLVVASAFERSFSTSFGQGPIEEISRIIAIATGAESARQKETMIEIDNGALHAIDKILSDLRGGNARPNWRSELARIHSFQKRQMTQRRILSDLWIKRDGTEIFISIKTVKPNIDQTEIAKKDLLMLKAHNPAYQTFFGLYYNPGGPNRADYNWLLPSKIFDMLHDECVLIGRDYWDFIGGYGTYAALLEIFGEVGKKTRKKLTSLGH